MTLLKMEGRKNISGRPATQIEIEMVGSIANLQDQLHEMKQSRDFYKLQYNAIANWAVSLPEPYKTQLSDIVGLTSTKQKERSHDETKRK